MEREGEVDIHTPARPLQLLTTYTTPTPSQVAALNILLAAAGPSPYKLVRSEYKELVVELKKLLSHSHFSVVNHALKALEALFSGVGASLYPHARPLIKVILDKAKDKKLTSYCARALDTIFGNVVGFADLVEEAKNAKESKNNITRITCWQWVAKSSENFDCEK